LRSGKTRQHTERAAASPRSSRARTLRDWPVSWRLIALIVLALIMGLVFGGLRVAAAAGSAAQFGRVSQLASLGQQVTGLVQALQDERDETTGVSSGGNPDALAPWYQATDAAAARVRALAAGVGGSFPANIQASVATVLSEIAHLGELRKTAQASQDALAVIANYEPPISDMITLNDLIAQGISDPILVNDVRTLNSLSLAKDEASQQRALFYHAFTDQFFGDGEQQALTTALSEELNDKASFEATATPEEQNAFTTTVAGPGVNLAEGIEDFILVDGNPADITQIGGISLNKAPARWYSAMSDKIDKMQAVELEVAKNIVARSQVLRRDAEQSALLSAVLTTVILFLVLIATLAVARSLVRPLRKLREGALDIATVQLPERVRRLGEETDPATSLDVAPIDVLSADEIGQVARAFDQVHAEAVRLAGNEAMLRNSFNAMFVNLSRRSQSLIERLARMIDSLEQNEADPSRLSNLFSMDHLVTRMRRNSENLLLLAGHETARKWSEPVPLADVVRAATSEIEQYGRVAMKVQPGISVTGPAVSDVVHLLAEIIENATIFSPKDTPVHISGEEIPSGGLLIEVSDSGVGVPEARLKEMNMRLDNPPVIDVSVSRHMGLFAVARLAERHGVRVRLRARSPRGLIALVWLPDSVTEHGTGPSPWSGGRVKRLAPERPASRQPASSQPASSQPASSQPASGQPGNGWAAAVPTPAPATTMTSVPVAPMPVMPTAAVAAAREPAQAADSAVSDWFHSPRSSAPGNSAPANSVPGNSAPGSGESPRAAAQAAGGWRAAAGEWAEGMHAAQIVAEPVSGDRTAAGLPVRVPRANLIAGSAGSHRAGGATSRPADGRGTQTSPAARAPRSPEQARNRLSGFQRGSRRAKGQTPRAGEGADR
jgi:signal transduction histidine kinase